MGTRMLSLWLPYLAIDRIHFESRRSMTEPRNLPIATCLETREDQPLVALSEHAEQAGLFPGMSRAEAVKRVPRLVTHPVDPENDERFLRTCLSWCKRYTPFVAIDRSFAAERGAALWLDIGSSTSLSGDEARLLLRLLGRLRKAGLTAKAAIADHPGSAWAACRFGSDEQCILPANGSRVALAPWPIKALRLEKAICDKLESAGFDRIEHLYALPRRSLGEHFGDLVVTRLDQVLGLVDEPIAVDTPLPAQRAQMIFAEPITDPDALPSLIEHLVRQLCIVLEAAGLGLRRLTLALYRIDKSDVTCSIGTDCPSRNISRLSALIGNRFDMIDLGSGLERAILDAVEIEPLLSEGIGWRGLDTATDASLPDIAITRRKTKWKPAARRQQPSEWRACLDAGHARKSQASLSPLLVAERSKPPSLTIAASASATALALSPLGDPPPLGDQHIALWKTEPRPLHLLRRPEPIEAISSLPGDPPALFRWRQRVHKVVGTRGPEPIAPDWWRLSKTERPSPSRNHAERRHTAPPARDYFAVEDSEGARFWLFCEGRSDEGSTPPPRWFLHGVFG